MGFTDNFRHPKGLLGRLMLISMDKEHLPMVQWSFTQFEIPEKGDIIDLGCGGSSNIQRMLEKCKSGKIVGYDISEESVKKAKKKYFVCVRTFMTVKGKNYCSPWSKVKTVKTK